MLASVLLVGWGWSTADYLDAVEEIEQLGFHACYIGDDLFAHQADVDVGTFEPWTMLPAMAMRTSSLRLGSLVSPVGRRHPGLFAKITATADLISDGRMIVGMGAGNAPAQQRSLAAPFATPAERVAMLAEELEVLRSYWTEDRTNFTGEWYTITGGICEPKPARAGGPEILLGVQGARMIELASKYADRVNVPSAQTRRISEVADAVRTRADAHGRVGDDIIMSRLATVILTDRAADSPDASSAAIEARAAEIGMDPATLRHEVDEWIHSYVGPVDGVADWVRESTDDVGLDELVVSIDTIDTVGYDRTMAGLRSFAAALGGG